MRTSKYVHISITTHHSHMEGKDSRETRAILLIFLFELEIFGVAVKRIHQNS